MGLLVVSNEGERYLLARTLNTPLADFDDMLLHLYVNDYMPTGDWTLADVVECSLPGYSPITLLNTAWSEPATFLGVALSQWGVLLASFSVTSGTAYIYGYYLTNNAGTLGVWAQRFASPFLISSTLPLTFDPQLSGQSLSAP